MPPKKIQVRTETRAGATVYRLDGPIDENVTPALQGIAASAPQTVVFGFRDVVYVNSSGLRSWVMFIRDFVKNRVVSFEECSAVVVSQMNMLPAFHAKTSVESVFLPVACPSCRHATNVLIPRADFSADLALLAPQKCPKCGAVTEPSNADDDFFSFAFHQARSSG